MLTTTSVTCHLSAFRSECKQYRASSVRKQQASLRTRYHLLEPSRPCLYDQLPPIFFVFFLPSFTCVTIGYIGNHKKKERLGKSQSSPIQSNPLLRPAYKNHPQINEIPKKFIVAGRAWPESLPLLAYSSRSVGHYSQGFH